jgi:predicted DCC family thiol-disulfide oxidoreductase YuxK
MIVFYDEECGLCQRSVQLLLFLDRKKELFYAPINGENYKTYVPTQFHSIDTIVYYKSPNQIYIKSSAIIEVLKSLGGFNSLAIVFYLIPKMLRDFFYDIVAVNRKFIACKLIDRSHKQFLK